MSAVETETATQEPLSVRHNYHTKGNDILPPIEYSMRVFHDGQFSKRMNFTYSKAKNKTLLQVRENEFEYLTARIQLPCDYIVNVYVPKFHVLVEVKRKDTVLNVYECNWKNYNIQDHNQRLSLYQNIADDMANFYLEEDSECMARILGHPNRVFTEDISGELNELNTLHKKKKRAADH